MGEAKRRTSHGRQHISRTHQFQDWEGCGPDPYLPQERSFASGGYISVDYNLMMRNYLKDVADALKTGRGGKLARYNRMIILNAEGVRVFPETKIDKLVEAYAKNPAP